MSAHRVRYEGPPGLALETATRLADAPGVELTSAGSPEALGGDGATRGRAGLTLTLEGEPEAVRGAVEAVRVRLPAGARVEIVEGPPPAAP